MTSIIKNQIIKHLSKFVRNITADQISVQILSGKGELKNIELNEIVLSEVLELPTWLRVKRAVCNRIAVKVPWTKLKSQPVKLFIDEVRVEVELSSEEVIGCDSNSLSAFGDSTYGFANRVAELMSLYVNSVEIDFDSGVFRGSLTLSRLAVESKSPTWQTVNDLRYTRLVDTNTSKLLMFKMVTWQLLRIEASAQANSSCNAINAPLRLITSNGKSRISVKKSTADGSVLGGRIQVILDDILWIATLPQIRSAITFYDHIMNIVKAASKKVPTLYHTECIEIKPPVVKSPPSIPVSAIFRNFDFDRTSYHVYVGKIDLHLCDDNQTSDGYPEDWDIICGALQVTLLRLSVDFYPANNAISDRSDWIRYDNANHCATWVHKILQFHLRKLCTELDASAQSRIVDLWPELMSQNCVIRIYDVIVQCVTDMNSKKEALFNLFMSDRKLNITARGDYPVFHLEFTSFYHPTCENFPVPSNITHLLLGPFFFVVDQRTIRWLLFIIDDIKYALQISSAMPEASKIPKTYLRINLFMPKIIIPLKDSFVSDTRFARRIVISMSTLLATNYETVSGDESNSFFKSISSNTIDFIDHVGLLVSTEKLKEFVLQLNQNSCENVDEAERIWINTSPVRINTDFAEEISNTPLLGDVAFHALLSVKPVKVSMALQPMSKIRIAVDHFQFLQIMRLISCISTFVDQLVNDQKFFSANRSNGNGPAIEMICFLDEAELNIILPIQPVPTPYDLKETVLQSPATSSDGKFFFHRIFVGFFAKCMYVVFFNYGYL
uniref:Chorein_N domain-containing protein n=1 Tax=Wuchereria bancrofti TaxID=6293 RepID=A0AAF5PGS6_WUCBA